MLLRTLSFREVREDAVTKEELLKRIGGSEWSDIEFKEAKRSLPRSVFDTVSSFSNTHGGWLVCGVGETESGYVITGVENVDKVQNDFLSALRADNKVNHDIAVQESLITVEGKSVLVFRIPGAPRHHKPIYLNGDIRRTFIRRGGCDHKATMGEIERLLRDAGSERWDSQVFEYPWEEVFDQQALQWYRMRFHEVNPGHDRTQSDKAFLLQWGYVLRQGSELKPTRGSILLFGTMSVFHHLMPRPTLDVQWIPSKMGDPLPDMRWYDRVVYEENLISTWQGLVAKYFRNEQRPFQGIDPHTLMREDAPPGFRVFREAAINLLMHQDYADPSRKAVIKFYRDGTQFWNPGDVFGEDENLLEPGEKEARNPRIAAAFRRLALCEQAGTGMRMMSRQWCALGNPEPEYINDRSRKAFTYTLFLAPQPESRPEWRPESRPEWLGDRVLLLLKTGTKSKSELSVDLGHKTISGQLKKVLRELLGKGHIEYTIPDKPTSRLQKYRLTESGIQELSPVLPKEK